MTAAVLRQPLDPAWLSRAGVGSEPWGPRRAAPNAHADSGGPAPQGQTAVPGTAPRPVPIRIRSRVRGHSKVRRALSLKGRVQLGRAHGRGGSSGELLLLGPVLRWGSGGFGRVLRHRARFHGTAS